MTSNYDKKACGARIKALRKKRNMTQTDLANSLHTTVSNIGKIENGFQGFSVDLLIEMRNFFNVPADYLLCGGPLLSGDLATQLKKVRQAIEDLGVGIDSFITNE